MPSTSHNNFTVTNPTAQVASYTNRTPTPAISAANGTCWQKPPPTIYCAAPSPAQKQADIPSHHTMTSQDPIALAQAREWLLQLLQTNPQAIRHVNTIVSAASPTGYSAELLPTLTAPMSAPKEDTLTPHDNESDYPIFDILDRTDILEHNVADASNAITLVADQVCELDKAFTTQINDIDMTLEERMDTVAQTIADGLQALGTTATTVQTDLALLSTKQTLSSTKEKVWWAETKRSLVALQSDIMDDRAATTQCLRELRESMQAMTTMMGQMINLVQYHNTLPMTIDTHGGSSPTNTPTPSSHDESATATILSTITTTLSTITAGQETLAGTMTKLSSAVTDMAATNQSQLYSTLDHLTTLTRESSNTLA